MRILAYAILIFGFFWICFCQFEIPPIARAVMLAQCDKIPKQQSYKIEDVRLAIHDAVADMEDHIPLFFIGACIMLVGGMILDWTKRRK
jgi:hypothetical protein